MALLKKKPSELPSDAVVLSSEEALNYEWKVINGWKNRGETWALIYGPGILGGMSAATGVFINHYYRRKLKLGRYGHLTSYLPVVVLPAMTTTIFHKIIVQRAVILNSDVCPVCIEIRALAIQTICGLLHPVLIAPFASFMFATRHFTYRLPSITENPKEVFKLWKKLTNPITGRLAFGFAVHAIVAMIVTFKEMQNFYLVQNKLIELEERLENSV